MCKFRTLNSEEVELRVAQAGKTKERVWGQYLIYNDARVDQNILDETVGPEFWQKSYEFLDGKLYCTVSIWNHELNSWVGKQDVGTESNTEKEKGQASDAFKRACFCWGIGRELYTAPQIYIDLNPDEYTEKDGKIYPKGGLFSVAEMEVKDGKITKLLVVDKNNNVRFPKGKKPKVQTTNVERVHPTISQLRSMAKRIASGEALTDKIQTNFLMSQAEWLKLDELIKEQSQK